MENLKEIWNKVKDNVEKYLGVWAWQKPLNWSDPYDGDWAPGWIANYLVIAGAVVLTLIAIL